MRHTLSRYLTTLLCMLAAGTWILPVHTLAAPAPMPAAPIDDGDETVALLALRDAIEAMRLAGEFDRAPFAFEGADLTGDGIADTIEVFPPQRLETPGTMRVVDGATGVERYTLRAPDDEMGFGDLAAVVGDCDDDGLPDLAVWSWMDVAGGGDPAWMRLRIRVLSGSTGDLIGLLEAHREIGSRASALEFQVVVAGDANRDEVLDVADVIAASAAVSSSAVVSPMVDFKMDGTLTVEEFGEVIGRVIEEPLEQRASRFSMALRNLAVVQPIAPAGSGIDPVQMGGGSEGGCVSGWQGGWDCWTDLFLITADFGWMAVRMTKCAGPLVTICIIEALCQLSSIIASLIEFVDECFTCGGSYPWWVEGIVSLTQAIRAVCEGLELLSTQLQVKIAKAIRDLLRKLGDFRF